MFDGPGDANDNDPNVGTTGGKAGFKTESGKAASMGTKQIAQIRWS